MKKLLVTLALSLVAACSMVSSAMDHAVGSAGNAAGNVVGTAVGNAVVARYSPQMMGWYTGYLFGLAFHSGGLATNDLDYKPGEETRWNMPESDGSTDWMERSRLADDAKGNQWWKVKFHSSKNDETTVLEGLFTPDKTKLLRLRGKFPNEEAKEIPVDEQTYYTPPQKLTAESIEGATKGVESVTVPAGTFKAQHIVYSYGNGTQEWWTTKDVPGGTVKQVLKSSDKEQKTDGHSSYELTLASFGKDAKTELRTK